MSELGREEGERSEVGRESCEGRNNGIKIRGMGVSRQTAMGGRTRRTVGVRGRNQRMNTYIRCRYKGMQMLTFGVH